MTQAPASDIPPFWTEPWLWAAPAWRGRYGTPVREVERQAARLLYSGWVTHFGLVARWQPPADPRWLALVQVSPAALQGVATVLGRIALLRAGSRLGLERAVYDDRWLACALRYRDVNCMQTRVVGSTGDALSPHACGVSVLCAMAWRDWHDAGSRIAMLVGPDAPALDGVFSIDSIDTGRCLAVGAAVARRLAADHGHGDVQ